MCIAWLGQVRTANNTYWKSTDELLYTVHGSGRSHSCRIRQSSLTRVRYNTVVLVLQDPTNELRLSLKRVIKRCPNLVRKNRKLAILSNGFSQRSPILLCFGKSLSVTCWRFKGQRSSPVFDGLHRSSAGFFYLSRKIVNIQYIPPKVFAFRALFLVSHTKNTLSQCYLC